jgi:uncharacterized membrane protein YccF (DUF307 family)
LAQTKKCGKRKDAILLGVDEVDDPAAVYAVSGETIGVPTDDADWHGLALSLSHHFMANCSRPGVSLRFSTSVNSLRISRFSLRAYSRSSNKLRFYGHHLLVVILCALASVEKIFWFELFHVWNPLWDFTARQAGAAGNTAAIFSAQNRRCMPISAEVSFGGAIISFARTFFAENGSG